ncbi:hypothetical protein C8J57DRAFT_1235476 [Mycena rebaudengoi]|nr:hypothetical protein C8J57DRAFT_1235476 [Mycena rebaudengoi]
MAAQSTPQKPLLLPGIAPHLFQSRNKKLRAKSTKFASHGHELEWKEITRIRARLDQMNLEKAKLCGLLRWPEDLWGSPGETFCVFCASSLWAVFYFTSNQAPAIGLDAQLHRIELENARLQCGMEDPWGAFKDTIHFLLWFLLLRLGLAQLL